MQITWHEEAHRTPPLVHEHTPLTVALARYTRKDSWLSIYYGTKMGLTQKYPAHKGLSARFKLVSYNRVFGETALKPQNKAEIKGTLVRYFNFYMPVLFWNDWALLCLKSKEYVIRVLYWWQCFTNIQYDLITVLLN